MTRRDRTAWLAVFAMGVIAASPWITGVRNRLAIVVRSLMPWAGLLALPVAVVARLTGRRSLAVASGTVAAATAVMVAPLVIRSRPPVPTPGRPLSIAHANLLYINRRIETAGEALGALDADIVTFSEYTPAHAEALRSSPLADGYPHRIELPARLASGTGLWSRFPVTERPTTRTKHHTVVADVEAPGGDIRVVVIHTQSPLINHHHWSADLDQLARMPVAGPTVMTGDFNAAWWHPEFRRVIGSTWRDAHIALGHGLSCSWPTDAWHHVFAWHPPFVRLDHALVTNDLIVLDVVDVDVPGSDHRGLVVTVGRARPAAL